MKNPPDLIEASLRLRSAMDNLELRDAINRLLHELEREIKFIEQQQRIIDNLKQQQQT